MLLRMDVLPFLVYLQMLKQITTKININMNINKNKY